jgi:cytochrome c553
MLKRFLSGLITISLGIFFSISVLAEANIERGKAKYKTCVACHGENAAGKKINNAPRLSGQMSWYLVRQLHNFKNGIRGTHVNDITGMQMKPMAIHLTDKDIEDVVSYIVTLKGPTKHSGVVGDVESGKSSYAVCVSCHGANGEGNKALNAPKIAGLQDWYVERQLNNFKIGIRGVHNKDLYGQQMRPMSMTLANDDAVRNVSVYLASLKGVSTTKPLAIKASTVVTVMQSTVSEPLYAPCASCHGSEGEGNQKLGAPRLAGQHRWYIERQLRNWRDGIRGTHSEDLYGMQMRPMAITLLDDVKLNKVVSFIGTLKGKPLLQTIEGNLDSGKAGYMTCMACHGAQGEGNEALNAPKIAGLQDWYVARQLKSFRKGIRGSHQKDLYGMQMRPMAMSLNDEAINNLASYVSTFSAGVSNVSTEGTETEIVASTAGIVSGSAKDGKLLYAVCVSCHGADGAGNKALNAPRISGQQEWYVARQIANFKTGVRGSHAEDIYGQQMRPMAMILANEQAVADVSAYLNTLKSAPAASTVQGDAAAGKAAYGICASCHGANGEGNKALNAPAIAGQHDWYIVRQLQNFKKRIRGDAGDTYGQQMSPMAMTLADDAAINNVAAYISTFK